MTVDVERDIVSWDNLDGLVADLASRLTGEFDMLLAITRGGLVPAGMLAYRLTNARTDRRVVVLDRTSGAKDVLVARSQYASVELSQDEQRLALSGDGDIWVLDIADRRTA